MKHTPEESFSIYIGSVAQVENWSEGQKSIQIWDFNDMIGFAEFHAKMQNDKLTKQNAELAKEITKLQEKYDENGYDCSPMIKLQRIEATIDSVIKHYAEKEINLRQQNAELIEALEMSERLIAAKVGNMWHEWPESKVIRETLSKSKGK